MRATVDFFADLRGCAVADFGVALRTVDFLVLARRTVDFFTVETDAAERRAADLVAAGFFATVFLTTVFLVAAFFLATVFSSFGLVLVSVTLSGTS